MQEPIQHLELTLWVYECSCVCGNTWTHSQPLFRMGGTPSPTEEFRGKITSIVHTRRNYNHCHRCAPLGVGVGWQRAATTTPAPAPQPAKPRFNKEDLDEL